MVLCNVLKYLINIFKLSWYLVWYFIITNIPVIKLFRCQYSFDLDHYILGLIEISKFKVKRIFIFFYDLMWVLHILLLKIMTYYACFSICIKITKNQRVMIFCFQSIFCFSQLSNKNYIVYTLSNPSFLAERISAFLVYLLSFV